MFEVAMEQGLGLVIVVGVGSCEDEAHRAAKSLAG